MSLLQNPKTKVWEGDFRDRVIGRLHLSLRTTKQKEARPRHEAVAALIREGHADLVDRLRRRDLNVEAVEACVRERRPFADLRTRAAWPTVGEAADAYVGWLETHPEKAAKTAEIAKSQLALFRLKVGEATPLDAVTLDEAAAYQAELARAYAKNTVTNYVGRAIALYAWAARREEREARQAKREARALHCPFDPETRPTGRTRRERFLTREEAALVIAATPAPLLALVGLGLLAGLRIEEALHLRPGVDVDLGRDMLVIQERGARGQPDYWRPKTGKRREIPIVSDLRPILAHHTDRYASESYLIPGTVNPTRPMWDTRAREHVKAIVERAGLVWGRRPADGVVFHTLRHTFAAWLVMQDVNPYRVAKLLGNSLKMVEETYGHLMPADNRRAVETLSGAVRLPTFDAEPAADPAELVEVPA